MKVNKSETIPVDAGFPAWPLFDDEDVAVVAEVLKSGKVNRWTGQENLLFEEEFAAFTGCDYSVALANGTVALELALFALGVGENDEVIVTSRSFVASASVIVARGAIPIFADVDYVSQNVTAQTIKPHISPRTKAIIAVHLAGWPCEMDAIMDLARHYNLKVVEDCAQALGATYKGHSVGSLGDVAAFSFCQDKIMTTGGEGGMLATNDPEIWEKAWAFKDHGKNFSNTMQPHSSLGFRWLHDTFGTNWRMTEMQAALGRRALRKMPEWLRVRRHHADCLTRVFKDIPGLRVTEPPHYISHAYYKYYAFVTPEKLNIGIDRDSIMRAINEFGIPCGSGSCGEIYLEEAFVKAGLKPSERLQVARNLGETSLMFLVHPTLTDENMAQTCDVVSRVFPRESLSGVEV